MELNRDQRRAVAELRKLPGVSVLTGYAGTGKTTLAAQLPELLGFDPGRVLFLAPTHKACAVLRYKLDGRSTVRTVASALWQHLPYHCSGCRAARSCRGEDCHTVMGDDKCCFWQREPKLLVPNYAAIVVDEASMLRRDDHDELGSRGVRTILVGDPGQLPPVDNGCEGFSAVARADVELRQIMRQGPSSEILAVANAVRHGEPVEVDEGCQGEVWPHIGVPPWDELAARYERTDIAVIVPTNELRRKRNAEARAAYGLTGQLAVGDLLMANQNSPDAGIYNGMLAEVVRIGLSGTVRLRSLPDGALHDVKINRKGIDSDGHAWNYGYAFTAHKAQGSEWPVVVVYPRKAHDRRRWCYTAYTRASELLIIAK